MSKESKHRDLWRQLFAAAHNRPATWCTGCGYYNVVHSGHREDCTRPGRSGPQWTAVPAQEEPHPKRTAIPAMCAGCAAPLHAHNLTRLCSECKLIARNRRLTGQPTDTADPVTPDQAIANAAAVLGARTIHQGAHLA